MKQTCTHKAVTGVLLKRARSNINETASAIVIIISTPWLVTMLGIAVIVKNGVQIFTLSPARLIQAEGQKFVPHFLQLCQYATS